MDQKLHPLHLGPCEVLEVVRANRYRVKTPSGVEELHGEELKAYVPEPGTHGVPYLFYCPPDIAPERDTWTVEKIIGHRQRGGRLQWRCRWRGFGPDQDTWEYAESFVHGIQTDWLAYNKKNRLTVQVQDLHVQ